ncbi:MAG: 16S rRNA (cytosine(1402)-N(4))-methyltransferase RsmH [Clostridiales bacterium]|nr:16S rRNA (cytosine(1402)-N(4))-methyltransferase RsmH [Clostridiales bacterium]
MYSYHNPVMPDETIDALNVRPGGKYIDCTAGGGGHSSKILDKLSGGGQLICIDRDPQSVEVLKKRFLGRKVTIINDNFFNIKDILSFLDIEGADGILADLGVSSHQLDTPERGFSFHSDAPLDMRMGMSGTGAADIVNTLPQKELQRIIYAYGEERFAPSIARNIVKAREKEPIRTTGQIAKIICESMPASARRSGHPARKTFQALRIEVNGELERLGAALEDMFGCLNHGGRMAVITFHSLEDRIVKKTFAALCSGCSCPPDFPVCVCGKKPPGFLPRKAVSPGESETAENPRSRSARLRVIEKY